MYEKLPKKIRTKFLDRSDVFCATPFESLLNNHSVDPLYPACRSISVTGDYRAIFKQEGNAVNFIAIGTHPQLYKQ